MEKEPKVEVVYSSPLEQTAKIYNKIRELEGFLQTTLDALEGLRKDTERISYLMDFEKKQEVKDDQMGVIIELDKLRRVLGKSLEEYARITAECVEVKGSLQKMHERWLEILRASPKDTPQ
jgi:regulator of replication initiation timing